MHMYITQGVVLLQADSVFTASQDAVQRHGSGVDVSEADTI